MTDERRPSPPSGDNAVGYARPPPHTRFQPGRSGNPKGRPKGSKNFSTLFFEELAQPVILTEIGRRRRMPKRQALAKQVINKPLSNDSKAAALDQIRRSEGSAEGPATIKVDQPANKQACSTMPEIAVSGAFLSEASLRAVGTWKRLVEPAERDRRKRPRRNRGSAGSSI
jgi:Family of unknown function (DUF5681)